MSFFANLDMHLVLVPGLIIGWEFLRHFALKYIHISIGKV